jgi:sigma-B regulation protein RsbU (phosphoserine phosphatase)
MKSPFRRLSPKVIRLLFSAGVVIVLSVCALNFINVVFLSALSNDQCGWLPRAEKEPGVLITDVAPDGVTDRAGVQNGDILLAIDGEKIQNTAQAMGIINQIAPGDSVVYSIERAGETFETYVVILKVVDLQYIGLFSVGILFLFVGYIVVLTRPEGTTQRMFAWFGLMLMLFMGLSRVLLPSDPRYLWITPIVLNAFIVARILGLPAFILFFLQFPVRRQILDRVWFYVALHLLALTLALPYVGPLQQYVRLPGFVRLIVQFAPVASLIIGHWIFGYTYFKHFHQQIGKELRPAIVGLGIFTAVSIYMPIIQATDQFLIFTKPYLLLPALLSAIFPLSFGYSIFRYHLMDIDLVIKRSIVYAMITAVLAAVYLGLVLGLGRVMTDLVGRSDSQILGLVAFMIVALAFNPIKQRVQKSVDRIFYRERYNYQKALREFSRELIRQMDLGQILESIVNRISSTMHVESVAVVICDEREGCRSVGRNVAPEDTTFSRIEGGLVAALEQTKKPLQIGLVGRRTDAPALHESDRAKIERSGMLLAIPMFLQERLIGMVNVGPKLSGRMYSQEDVDLLETVAGQAAIAIENARLHQSEIERQKIEEELALARNIQQGLLPKELPEIPGLEVTGISLPASTVGGDYFDFIELDDKRFLVVVADVSGKGMSAALYMSKIQGMVQLAAHLYDSPKEMLVNANKRIYEGIERKSFITMILALFDVDRREVTICRAGHNKALLSTNGDLEYLEAKGMGLGLEPGPLFEETLQEVRRPLSPGGVFLFYTDGLTETMNIANLELGEEAVRDVLMTRQHLSAEQIQQSLMTIAEEFRGSAQQHDDLTLVVVKVQDTQTS